MNNTMTEVKNTLEEIDSRKQEVWNKCRVEDKADKNHCCRTEQRKKRIKKMEDTCETSINTLNAQTFTL